MNILEILDRPSPAHYTVEELQFAVEQYIKQKKNIDVTVNIFKGMPTTPEGWDHSSIIKMDAEYTNLMTAFNIVQREFDRSKL